MQNLWHFCSEENWKCVVVHTKVFKMSRSDVVGLFFDYSLKFVGVGRDPSFYNRELREGSNKFSECLLAIEHINIVSVSI